MTAKKKKQETLIEIIDKSFKRINEPSKKTDEFLKKRRNDMDEFKKFKSNENKK